MIQLHVEDPNETVMLLGISDQNMKLIEEQLNVSVLTRGDTISISGLKIVGIRLKRFWNSC